MNKNLYGKLISLPKEITEYLGKCFDYIPNSDPSIEGHKRNIDLRDKGHVSYQQLGRMKNWFDNYDGDGTDAPFILNGGEYVKNWTNDTITQLRKVDEQNTEIKLDILNTYKAIPKEEHQPEQCRTVEYKRKIKCKKIKV